MQDRGLLAALSVDERTRLLTAAADVHHPDIVQRRRWSKASRRREKAERLERDEAVLADAGIRLLRNKPVFTTPDPPRPAVGSRRRSRTTPTFREVVELQHCYVCKQRYLAIHHFYDQLCPSCGDFNYAKRGETADLRGRVALITGGRVKIGYQAGIKLLRAGAELIVTTRFPRDAAARYAREHDFEDWGEPARDLRARPAAHAERRGVLPPPQGEPAAARLHRQQRVSDRPPPAGLLPAHARARDSISAGNARARARAARRLRGPAPLRHASDRSAARRRAARAGRLDPRCRALTGAAPAGRGRRPRRSVPRRACSTRIFSRSICATATRGGCSSQR